MEHITIGAKNYFPCSFSGFKSGKYTYEHEVDWVNKTVWPIMRRYGLKRIDLAHALAISHAAATDLIGGFVIPSQRTEKLVEWFIEILQTLGVDDKKNIYALVDAFPFLTMRDNIKSRLKRMPYTERLRRQEMKKAKLRRISEAVAHYKKVNGQGDFNG